MIHVTCRLTAKNRDQFRNTTLGSRVWATFTFLPAACIEENWCRRDAGPIDYADSVGRRHTAYVSVTRDGSVWLRFQSAESGDDSSADWTYVDEDVQPLQLSVLEPSVIALLDTLNYTEFCALTDLQVRLL